MILNRRGVEFYDVAIDTGGGVDDDGWEASFDDGASWTDGAPVEGGGVHWLVAGDLAGDDAPDGTPMVTRDIDPLIRAKANPETIVRRGPRILLEA